MNQRLTELIRGMKPTTLMVVGDIILDRYVWGGVERVSPEAPVQVLDVAREEEMLGGAANVAANVAALGAKVRLVGVVGQGGDTRTVKTLLTRWKIPATGLVTDRGRPTIKKTRFMALRQQMLRVDRENRSPIPAPVEAKLIEKIDRTLPTVDGVVVSDYGKGTLTDAVLAHLIREAKRAGKPVIVDPKGRDYTRYAGASLITPNRKEAAEASGVAIATENDYKKAARILFAKAKVERILITRGPEGMTLFSPGESPLTLPAEALEVFDVSGAGDTVVAALAVFHFAGADLPDAARIANVAAAIEVGHVGAKAVTLTEVLSRLAENDEAAPPKKVMDQTRAARWAATLRSQGKSVVFTNGCFDLLHVGHVDYLEKARAAGDALIVGVNTDRSVRRLKGSLRPLAPQGDRVKVLAALSCVDGVVLFDDDTPARLIEKIRPNVLVKGGDYHRGTVVGADTVEADGGRVRIIPLVKGKSTTGLIDIIRSRYAK